MKEYQIKLSNDKKTKAVSLELSGRLNVENISRIQKEVNAAIKNSKIINIKVADVDESGLSFIQFLVALRRKSQKSEVEFNIDLDLNNEITELFKRSGFSKVFD